MEEIKQLLDITRQLCVKYNRGFTLDGKLVGDIGEVLAAQNFDITLLPEQTKTHDAQENGSQKLIQIKSSMKNNFYFPNESKMPDYFLCINILESSDIEVVYNGKGSLVFDNLIKGKRKGDATGYMLNTNKLKKLKDLVKETDKIKWR